MKHPFTLCCMMYAVLFTGMLRAEIGTAISNDVIVDTRDYSSANTGIVTVDTRDPPSLATPSALFVLTTSASLGADVLNDGGGEIVERGIVYATAAANGNPFIGGNGVTQRTAAGTIGAFLLPVTGLPAGTGIVFRAYAINVKGISYTTATAFSTLTLLQGWRQANFGIVSGTGNAADDADPDGDGLKNLLEYALNLPPNAASRVPANMQATGGNLEYTYTRGTAAFNGGTIFQVEWSDELSAWSSAGVVETLLSDDGTYQQVKATIPAGSGGRRFVRLRVQ